MISTESAPITQYAARKTLEAHDSRIRNLHLRKLFSDDPTRSERMAVVAAGIFLDYSKNPHHRRDTNAPPSTRGRFRFASSNRRHVRGKKINIAEKPAELHGCTPGPRGTPIALDGENVVREVHAVLDKLADSSNRVHRGAWKGHTGQARGICAALVR